MKSHSFSSSHQYSTDPSFSSSYQLHFDYDGDEFQPDEDFVTDDWDAESEEREERNERDYKDRKDQE